MMIFDRLQNDPFWRGEKAASTILRPVNTAILSLDDEIFADYRHLRDLFAPRFPELLTVHMNPLSFALVILRIGESVSLRDVDFEGILGTTETLAIRMIAGTSKGAPLSDSRMILKAAQRLSSMCELRDELSEWIKKHMMSIAPNVSAIVGPSIAAKLISSVGGIVELSHCPSNNIQVIGRDKSKPLSFGFVGECDLIAATIPPDMAAEYTKRAVRMIAAKVALAARADVSLSSSDGAFGSKLRSEIIAKLEKQTEPLPYKIDRPLPPPIVHSKKKRGGKRARRLKEMTAMTQLRRQQDRIAFAQPQDELYVHDKIVSISAVTPRITAIDHKLRDRVKKQSERALTGVYAKRQTTTNPFSFDAEKALLLKKL